VGYGDVTTSARTARKQAKSEYRAAATLVVGTTTKAKAQTHHIEAPTHPIAPFPTTQGRLQLQSEKISAHRAGQQARSNR
jgi:hypothetical protein